MKAAILTLVRNFDVWEAQYPSLLIVRFRGAGGLLLKRLIMLETWFSKWPAPLALARFAGTAPRGPTISTSARPSTTTLKPSCPCLRIALPLAGCALLCRCTLLLAAASPCVRRRWPSSA
eukprot:9468218-Pyramimonas_sp.AAC.1